jgi:hypothetical protein
MTYTPFNDDDDTYRPELPNQWERTPSYAPTPSYAGREWTPLAICPSAGPEDIVSQSSPSLYYIRPTSRVLILWVNVQMEVHGMKNLRAVSTTRSDGELN